MSFTLNFDYRFDSMGFFDDQGRRAALEAAAAQWEAIIEDEFTDVPSGISFNIRNPSTLSVESVTLDQPIDDILIFVGATRFVSSTLAIAGPDGGNVAGDRYAARISDDFRSLGAVSDFEPWAGSITFNANSNWSFALDGPVEAHNDFISVAVHEIGHILGIGASATFGSWINDHHFTGPNATRINGGQPIPIEDDHAHVEEGFADDTVALDPVLITGNRVEISAFDKAILADIGFEIAGFEKQGSKIPIATASGELIFGSDLEDIIDGLAGDDAIQGAGGDDQLIGNAGLDDLFGQEGHDTLFGGDGNDYLDGGSGDDELRGGPGADVFFGHGGQDTFVIAAGDGSNRLSDFEIDADTIRLIDSGFSSASQVIDAITKPFNNVSRITLNDGTMVDVFHKPQNGTPLTSTHIVLGLSSDDAAIDKRETSEPNDRSPILLHSEALSEDLTSLAFLVGTPADNTFEATSDHERIDGQGGVDMVQLAGSQSNYIVAFLENGLRVTDRTVEDGGTLYLDNIELLDFEIADPWFRGPMDLRQFGGHQDLDASSLNAFVELYVAYFNRAPDAIGLGFWGTAYANGATLEDIAGLFAQQQEMTTLYPDDLSNFHFISQIYQNVLGRMPDMNGLLFWDSALESGSVSRSDFILDLLIGAKANLPLTAHESLLSQQAEDQQYLELKTDLGAIYALERGLSDLDGAALVMAMFDGTTASFEAATALIDDLHTAALDPVNGSFLMPLVGVSALSDIA